MNRHLSLTPGDALRQEVFRSMNVSTSSKTPYSDATQVSQSVSQSLVSDRHCQSFSASIRIGLARRVLSGTLMMQHERHFQSSIVTLGTRSLPSPASQCPRCHCSRCQRHESSPLA